MRQQYLAEVDLDAGDTPPNRIRNEAQSSVPNKPTFASCEYTRILVDGLKCQFAPAEAAEATAHTETVSLNGRRYRNHAQMMLSDNERSELATNEQLIGRIVLDFVVGPRELLDHQ